MNILYIIFKSFTKKRFQDKITTSFTRKIGNYTLNSRNYSRNYSLRNKLAFWKCSHYIGTAGKSSLEKIVSSGLFPYALKDVAIGGCLFLGDRVINSEASPFLVLVLLELMTWTLFFSLLPLSENVTLTLEGNDTNTVLEEFAKLLLNNPDPQLIMQVNETIFRDAQRHYNNTGIAR